MILAVVPARGGSKRLPEKNITTFAGRPLLAWSVALAKKIDRVAACLVSTEDDEIAAVARAAGADVVDRPPDLAGDDSSILEVIIHAARTARMGGTAFDGVMLAGTFAGASADIVERAQWRSEGVALVVIRVEGISEIRTAFGPEVADDITGACRQAVRRYAPASAIVGEDGADRLAVCALATTAADARRLGATIYRGCTEELARSQSVLQLATVPPVDPRVQVVVFGSPLGRDRYTLIENRRTAGGASTEPGPQPVG